MRARPPVAQRYLIGLWSGALLLAAVTVLSLPLAPLSVAQIAAAAAFALLLDIADLLTLHYEADRPVALAQAPIIACVSVLFWPLPLLTIAVGMLATALAHPAPRWRTLTTFAMRIIVTSLLGVIAALTLPAGGTPFTTPLAFGGLVAMGVVAYGAEHLLETLLALFSKPLTAEGTHLLKAVRAGWTGRLGGLGRHMLVVVPLGGLLALLWSLGPWAFMLGLAPALVAYWSFSSRHQLADVSRRLATLSTKATEQDRKLSSLQNLATTLIATRDIRALPHTLCDRLAALLGAPGGWVVLHDDDPNQPEGLLLVARTGRTAAGSDAGATELSQPLPATIARGYDTVLNRRRVVLFTDQHVQSLAPAGDEVLWQSLIVIPLLIEEDQQMTPIGAICLAFDQQRGLAEEEQRLLRSFGRQAALAVQNARLFRQLRESQAELIRSSQLAAVGTFAAGIAHEFNNLLAGMIGYAQLGLSTTNPDEKDESLRVVVDACRRGKSVTGSLLTFARRQQAQRTPADIGEAVTGTLTLMEIELRQNDIKVLRRIEPVPQTVCDVGQLAQVFLNLLTNARDAMKPDGGTLTVELGERGGTITLAVEDTGCGIPDAIRERIFEPFVTTKGALGGSQTPGTGLGLSVSYGIVQEHGGTIEVTSNAGLGTRVAVRLPVVAGATSDRQATLDPPPKLRLLLVDDDDRVRDSLRRLLEQAGHRVSAVSDAASALEQYRQQPFDLVLTDLAMPRTNGLTLVRWLRDHDPDATIFVFTGQALGDQIELAREAGAVCVLHKPFELAEFQQAVAEAWRGERLERSVAA
ncbi:MAG: response regulator [Chloroflexales bacterium]|nr:response regulator [Chloroflexales bacterium]